MSLGMNGATAFPSYLIGLPAGGTWRVRFHSDSAVYSPDFANTPEPDVVATATSRDGLPFTGSVALGRYGLVVMSR